MNDAWPRAIDSVVFDLDGTLWDTCAACAIGWNNVAGRHGIAFRPITAEDVRSVTGNPHDVCIRRVFVGVAEPQLQILVEETQIEDNACIARYGGTLYAGVAEGLVELAQRFPLFIVSNCQSGYIETFLSCHGFGALFRDFECWGNTGRSKAENLRSLIERNRVLAPVMIGDTEGDMAAARACGVEFVHVTYGFAGCPGAELAAGTFAELCDRLLRND